MRSEAVDAQEKPDHQVSQEAEVQRPGLHALPGLRSIPGCLQEVSALPDLLQEPGIGRQDSRHPKGELVIGMPQVNRKKEQQDVE